MKPSEPALVGDLRRRRRVHADARSTTWEAWDVGTGERTLVRLLKTDTHPPTFDFPGLSLPLTVAGAGIVYVRTAPVACSLADLLPLEVAPGPAWTAHLALGVLGGLAAVHATGHAHGWVGAESVVATRAGWTVAWLGPVPDAHPDDDLRALGLLLGAIDPTGEIGELVGGFAESPPPSAADAARLVVHACSGLLARERHALVARLRGLGKASRRGRLRVMAQRLDRACPPPRAAGILNIDAAGVALRVESDGTRVRGARGPAQGSPGEGFAVWGPGGLDPIGARAVLRAWSAESPARDEGLQGLVRWLSAAARLRVDRRLLAYPDTESR
jgi:hypothetical protein